MKRFEFYLSKAASRITDAVMAILMCVGIYSREWFPKDVLQMELRLWGATSCLDVLGGLLLIVCMMAWLYIRTVIKYKVWMLLLGWYYKLSDTIRYVWENKINKVEG